MQTMAASHALLFSAGASLRGCTSLSRWSRSPSSSASAARAVIRDVFFRRVSSKADAVVVKPSSVSTGGSSKVWQRLGGSQMKQIMELCKPEKTSLLAAIGLLFVSSAITMSVPFAMGKIIDVINSIDQKKDDKELRAEFHCRLVNISLGLTAVFAVGGACNFGRVYLMRVSGQKITARLRSLLYSSIWKQEVAFFDRNKTGELVNRLSADSLLVGQTLTQQLSDGLRSVAMTSAGVGMMFYMSPELALVGLGIVPPVAAWAVFMGKKVRVASRNVQDSLADATQLAEERISNVRTVFAFAKTHKEIHDYNVKMDNVIGAATREAMISAKFYGMTGLSGNLIILSVLYYGCNLVASDVLTVGNLTSFILYAAYVGIGLSGMSSFYAEVMRGLGASGRIFDIIESAPKETLPLENRAQKPLVRHAPEPIVFKNVNFRYPERPDVNILSGLNLTVPAERITAVVGSSGSGKSTLMSLILRLYPPTSGSITLGQSEIQRIDVSQLRQRIAFVSQEPVLFSSSIRENIAYGFGGLGEPSIESIERAAKEANAHDFISGFPEGYDTLVGERGVLLSGGQKQRVAIARAILRDPEILLLDEATSALDAASEHLVQEALARVMQGRTVVTIAHRLSTILNAHKIAVVANGVVVEEGTFDELVAIPNGHFNQLVQKQTIQRDGSS